MVWRNMAVSLQQKTKDTAMRNTDYNIDALNNMISQDTNFQALRDMIQDLGLEFEEANLL